MSANRQKNSVYLWGFFACIACLFSALAGGTELWQLWWSSSEDSVIRDLIFLRLYRVIGIALAGSGLAVSGFLLQEYFKNPLAGPSVVGISSFSGLLVSVLWIFQLGWALPAYLSYGLVGSLAVIGSVLLLFCLFRWFGKNLNSEKIIIFGFLVSAFCGAVISVLQLYSDQSELKNYILWSFGNTQLLSLESLLFLGIFWCVGIYIAWQSLRDIFAHSLGSNYAHVAGYTPQVYQKKIIFASAILAGSVTAYLGHVLFIGIIIPHFTRVVYNGIQVKIRLLYNLILGIIFLEIFSGVGELMALPINIITSILGIPVISYILMKNKNLT